MAYESIDSLFTGICDAIRTKKSSTGLIKHQDIPNEILSIDGGGEPPKTIYDLDYIKENMVFWADGKSNDFNPITRRNDRIWVHRYGMTITGNLGSTPVWTEDGGLQFVERSTQSYARFNTYLTFSGSYTFECYVKYNATGGTNNECFSSRESGGFILGMASNQHAYFDCALTSGSAQAADVDVLNIEKKHLLTGIIDRENNSMMIYVDGILKNTVVCNYNIKNPNTCLWIGNDGAGASPESKPSSYAMIGVVYSARIYNRVLTDSEIMQNYNQDKLRFGD